MTPTEKLRAATGYLILHHPFIATPLLRLRLVPDPRQPTAATDGRSIFYREELIAGLTLEETIFLLAHEVLHVALAHHLRRGERNPKAWNAAADFAINLLLQEAGFSIISGALLEPAYAGWSTERVYRTLMAQAELALADALNASSAPGTPSSEPSLEDFIPQGAGGSVEDMKSQDGKDLSQAERSREEGKLSVALKHALQVQAMVRGDDSLAIAFSLAVSGKLSRVRCPPGARRLSDGGDRPR